MKKIVFAAVLLLSLLSCNQENKVHVNVVESKNQVAEAIMDRRSIRVYKPDSVAQNQLDTIVQCAINAPSALNKQSWEIRIVKNQEVLQKINNQFIENMQGKNPQGSAARFQEPGFNVFHNAPILIIVAKDKNNNFSEVDCGLLAQNITLSAQSMNLGTCIVGSVSEAFKGNKSVNLLQELEIPNTHEVIFGIALGHKAETPDAKPRDLAKVKYIN